MDQLQKLRLKILTNTNLKFLCTANKDWTVEQLYPHIARLYKEVTADQDDKNYHIQINTLKKNGYFIPQSQIVGEIFMDNDEVTCSIDFDKSIRKQQKKEEKIAENKEFNIEKEYEKLKQNEISKNSILNNEKNNTEIEKEKEGENNKQYEIQETVEKEQKIKTEVKLKEEKPKSSKAHNAPKRTKISKNPGDPKPVREKLNVDPEIIMSLIKLPKRDQSPEVKNIENDQHKENEQNSKNVENEQ